MVKKISNKKLPLLGRKLCNVIIAEKQQNRPKVTLRQAKILHQLIGMFSVSSAKNF